MGLCISGPPPSSSNELQTETIDTQIDTALQSLQITQKEIDYLSKVTKLDIHIIQQLFNHFNKISSSKINDGYIDADEFSIALGMNNNILSHRMFLLFNITKTNRMNFREFVIAISLLSKNSNIDDKIRFSFDLYDLNKDNKIDYNELMVMLKAALSENKILLTDKDIEDICTRTLNLSDLDGNGYIEFEEYKQLVYKNLKLLNPFTINLDELFAKSRKQVESNHIDLINKRPLENTKEYNSRYSDASIESLSYISEDSFRRDSFDENGNIKNNILSNTNLNSGITSARKMTKNEAVVVHDIDKVLD